MTTLKDNLSTLPRDIFAGIVVFLVALPLCLGVASASGVAPLAGILAGIIGGLVVATLSGSPLSVSGPAAGLVVIVLDGIAKLGGFSEFLLAVLLSGIIQFGFGVLRAGRFAAYVPAAVIKGMLAAIGLILIIKQLPFAIGLSGVGVAEEATPFSEMGNLAVMQTPFGSLSYTAIAITALSLCVIKMWDQPFLRRFALIRALPAPLVVVMLGITLTVLLDAFAPGFAPTAEHRVLLPALDSLAQVKNAAIWPAWSGLLSPDVWRLAVTLAIVGSLETLLNLEALEQIDPKKRVAGADRELKAQGVGNLIAGAFGALPITSVIVRSSVNVEAGANSRWSAIVHGLMLLMSIFLLSGIINLIPLSCLAAILISTGLKLTKPAIYRALARKGAERFVPFLVTVVGVLATDLLLGILLGVLTSIGLIILANLRRPITFAHYETHLLVSFRKDVSFLSKVALKQKLDGIPEGSTVMLDGHDADFIDPDVRDVIDSFVAAAPGRQITVECQNLNAFELKDRKGIAASLTTMPPHGERSANINGLSWLTWLRQRLL